MLRLFALVEPPAAAKIDESKIAICGVCDLMSCQKVLNSNFLKDSDRVQRTNRSGPRLDYTHYTMLLTPHVAWTS